MQSMGVGRRLGLVAALAGVLLGGCGAPRALQRAQAEGWQLRFVDGAGLRLLTAAKGRLEPDARLTVYVEGDGRAWRSRHVPAVDPTPRAPLALELALAQPSGARAYLGRPCQYRQLDAEAERAATRCSVRLWTSERFGTEALEASDAAISQLKRRLGAKRLRLVGYSGGGTLATLLTARRRDVDELVTVAAVLDTDAWTRRHGVTPLTGSLNPVETAGQLGTVRQWHVFGAADAVAPADLAAGFLERLPPQTRVHVHILPGVTHTTGWQQAWPQVLGALEGSE